MYIDMYRAVLHARDRDMSGWVDGWMYLCVYEWIYGCMDVWDGWMDGWMMDGWVDVWMEG